MARVKQLDQITGSLKNLSFYTRKGSDQIFVRTKGGATKDQIKRRPEFENVRKNNKEFGGCSKMSKQIRLTFFDLAHVADYNLSSVLCSLAKNIQKADTDHPAGERRIQLSKFRAMLTGFNFNTNNRFDTLLRIALQSSIDRETQQATVNIPAFACSFGLYLPNSRSATSGRTPAKPDYSLFRISISLGVATDLQLNTQNTGYEPVHSTLGLGYKTTSTPWYSTQASIHEQQLLLNINEPSAIFTDDDTLVLSIAIEFGTLDAFGNPTPVRGAGAGKLLGIK
jgi:hypothetical protein